MKQSILTPKTLLLTLFLMFITEFAIAQSQKFTIPAPITKTRPSNRFSCATVNNFVDQCFAFSTEYNTIISNLQSFQNSLNSLPIDQIPAKYNEIAGLVTSSSNTIERLTPTIEKLISSFTDVLAQAKGCVSILQVPSVASNMYAGLNVLRLTASNFGTLTGTTFKELKELSGSPNTATNKPIPKNEQGKPAVINTSNSQPVVKDTVTIKPIAKSKAFIVITAISFTNLQQLEDAIKKLEFVKVVTKKFNTGISTLEIIHNGTLSDIWNSMKANTANIVSDENLTGWDEETGKIDLAIKSKSNELTVKK